MQEPNEIKQIKNDSSVEITQNSRGFSFCCKAYGSTPKEIKDNLDDLVLVAKDKVRELEAGEEGEKV